MGNQLQIFENKDFGKVRVLEIDGVTWFVGKDIAEVLGYENGSRDIKRHVDNEDVGTAMIPQYRNGTLVSKTLIINESGLYSLIFSSKLPAAKAFKRWVTSEILPSIRYYDLVLKCENSIPLSVIAKDYGMTAISFNKLLNGLGVQYSVGGVWVLYKKYCNQGYTVTRTYHVNETTSHVCTYWTQKGRNFLYIILKCYGILPEAER